MIKRKIKFSIGYNHQTAFLELIRAHAEHIDEVYFSIPKMPSGRPRFMFNENADGFFGKVLARIRDEFPAIKLNLLFNGLSNHEDYQMSQADFAKKYCDLLDFFIKEYNVCSTSLASTILSFYIKEQFPQIETHTSVNMMVNDPKQLDYLTGFDVINFDREINRNFAAIRSLKEKGTHRLKILLNEGCLARCPNRIQCANAVSDQERFSESNPKIDFCGSEFNREPWHSFVSPIVRPEDLDAYIDMGIDYWKIGTRSLDTSHAEKIVGAYINRSWTGNLMWLVECPSFLNLADKYYIRNSKIPEVFLQQVTSCSLDCRQCAYCEQLWGQMIQEV